MVRCRPAALQHNHTRNERVANNDTKPSLPPCQAICDARRGNGEGIEVGTIGNPESGKVECVPRALVRTDRSQILVGQERLGEGGGRGRGAADLEPARNTAEPAHGGGELGASVGG